VSDFNDLQCDNKTTLPLVIQVGFSGARNLVDRTIHPDMDDDAIALFEQQVTQSLKEFLLEEIEKPMLEKGPAFFCGISQVAIGGDFAFSRACESLGWTQRIFLPQHSDAYLIAEGSSGPDFSESQRMEAKAILSLPHIIQERLVSDANDRHERLVEANLEIARVSDILVILERSNQKGKVGGSQELSQSHSRPTLKLTVGVNDNGTPSISKEWIKPLSKAPKLPPILENAKIESQVLWPSEGQSGPKIPKADIYIHFLKELGSSQAKWQQNLFRSLALIILSTHFLATMIAVVALKLEASLVLSIILGVEVTLLLTGLGVHHFLHHSHAVEDWANYRLLAEITRSVKGIGSFHTYLRHFFYLPMPENLSPLLKTISVLHLHKTRDQKEDWDNQRKEYISGRLQATQGGQIKYHQENAEKSSRNGKLAQAVFLVASLLAILATTTKLLAVLGVFGLDASALKLLKTGTGFLAVLMPVLAVAALSLSAALDLNAKEKTSKELLKFLKEQVKKLKKAKSAKEFERLLLQTESQLLGENVNWYARRSYISIS